MITRAHSRRRPVSELTLTLTLATALTFAFVSRDANAQTVVKLLRSAVAHSYPGGAKIAAVSATQPLTGAPTVLPVIGSAVSGRTRWVRVWLPGRPNGSTGWITADGTVRMRARWSVNVSLRAREAAVMRDGRVVRRLPVVIGAPRTPTPAGTFFITEKVRQPHGAAVGPVVLATSAYSNVLQEFDGGPGQIGLHGRTGLPGPLGSAASHGCIRFDDRAIRWLAARVSAGALVRITRGRAR